MPGLTRGGTPLVNVEVVTDGSSEQHQFGVTFAFSKRDTHFSRVALIVIFIGDKEVIVVGAKDAESIRGGGKGLGGGTAAATPCHNTEVTGDATTAVLRGYTTAFVATWVFVTVGSSQTEWRASCVGVCGGVDVGMWGGLAWGSR